MAEEMTVVMLEKTRSIKDGSTEEAVRRRTNAWRQCYTL